MTSCLNTSGCGEEPALHPRRMNQNLHGSIEARRVLSRKDVKRSNSEMQRDSGSKRIRSTRSAGRCRPEIKLTSLAEAVCFLASPQQKCLAIPCSASWFCTASDLTPCVERCASETT